MEPFSLIELNDTQYQVVIHQEAFSEETYKRLQYKSSDYSPEYLQSIIQLLPEGKVFLKYDNYTKVIFCEDTSNVT